MVTHKHTNKYKTLKKVITNLINYTLTLLLLLILAINISGLYQKFLLKQTPVILGYSAAVVLTGSMEDEIMAGDIIITRLESKYCVNDIITFKIDNPKYNGNTVTHRIVEETKDDNGNNAFITKGDANNIVDEDLVYNDDIIGKVVKIIPNGGKIINTLKTPEGLASISLIVFVVYGLYSIIFNKKEREANERYKENNEE